MGLFDAIVKALFPLMGGDPNRPLEPGRFLDVPSGENFRDLGGYDTPEGPTSYQRFVRAGTTSYLSNADLTRLENYGVRRVIDLRSRFEDPQASDRFARRPGVEWLNVPLFDYDLSDPKLTGVKIPDGNYLIDGYLTMISNRPAIRRIFEFCAGAPEGGAVLFHCAAGMDRTGMTAFLLLGLAGVPREQIVADYLYSFAPKREVDGVVFEGAPIKVREGSWSPLPSRKEAIEFMIDRVEEGYGTVGEYLSSCGIADDCLARIKGMMLG